jgi:hypothetical protein
MATIDTTASGRLTSVEHESGDTINVLHAMTMLDGDDVSDATVSQGSADGTIAVSGRCKLGAIHAGMFGVDVVTVADGGTLFAGDGYGGNGSNGTNGNGSEAGTDGLDGSTAIALSAGAAAHIANAVGGNGGNGGDGTDEGRPGGNGGNGGHAVRFLGLGEAGEHCLLVITGTSTAGTDGTMGGGDAPGNYGDGATAIGTGVESIASDTNMPCDVRYGQPIPDLAASSVHMSDGVMLAYQVAAYTSVANVLYGVDRGDGQTGTCHVPTASQTVIGVPVGVSDVGTFTHTSDYDLKTNYSDPGITHVEDGVSYTYEGNTLTGTLLDSGSVDMDDYVLKTAVVSPEYVASGHRPYTGSDNVGSFPYLSYASSVSQNTIVDMLAEASKLLSNLATCSTSWIVAWFDHYATAAKGINTLWPELGTAVTSLSGLQESCESFSSSVLALCQAVIISTAERTTGKEELSLTDALRVHFAMFKSSGLYAATPTLGYAISPSSANTGDIVVAASLLNGYGRPAYFAYAEDFTVVSSNASSAVSTESTVTSVSLTFASNTPAVATSDATWPQGSGASVAVTASASNNILTNGSFDDVAEMISSPCPNGWFLASGTLGTDVKLTNVPVQQIAMTGTYTPGTNLSVLGFWQIKHKAINGNTYITDRLAVGAAAAVVQSALRQLPGLDEVTVTSTFGDTSATYAVTFSGYRGSPELLAVVPPADAAVTFAVTATETGSVATYSTRAVQLPFGATEGTALCQLVSLGRDTVYFFSAKVRAVGTITAGEIVIDISDGIDGAAAEDSSGNAASHSIDASQVSISQHDTVVFSFRVSPLHEGPLYARIRVKSNIVATNAAAADGIYIDEASIVAGTQLYAGGPCVVGIFGKDPPSGTNTWTLSVTNNREGRLLDTLNRACDLVSLGVLPPTSGTTAIAESRWQL